MECILVLYLRSHCLTWVTKISSCFLQEVLWGLCCYCSCFSLCCILLFIYLFNFAYGAKYWSRFMFWYRCLIVLVLLVESTILSLLKCLSPYWNYLCTFVENQLAIYVWFYFCIFSLLFHWSMCLCFYWYIFVLLTLALIVSFEIR